MSSESKAREWLGFKFLSPKDKSEIELNLSNPTWINESFGQDLEFHMPIPYIFIDACATDILVDL